MFITRIVQQGKYFFVDYKWSGSLLKAALYSYPLYWQRYTMVPDANIQAARETLERAEKDYRLNRHNVVVVE